VKYSRASVVFLLLIIIIGIGLFIHIDARHEERSNMSNLLIKGNRLVSLIALHSIRDFEKDKGDFLMRSITDYNANQDLVYCFINDRSGRAVVSLAPNHLAAKIPIDIQMKALSANGLTRQMFEPENLGYKIFEFSKPIFENSQKSGTVRIGLKLPGISFFTMERIHLSEILIFLVISAFILAYYGFFRALRPLAQLKKDLLATKHNPSESSENSLKNLNITPIIEGIQESFIQVKERLEGIEANNLELTSQLGVMNFKKNQFINIINSINFGIIITDVQNNVAYINDYFLNLLIKNRQDALDLSLEELLNHTEINSFLSQAETFKHTNSSHLDTTFPELAPGEIFRISSSYLLDGNKAPIGKMVICANVTIEKKSEKTTKEFIAHLAHELKTPLTTIKSYSEMLMEGEIEEIETQKEFYNTINGETDRLTRLINDLLNMSKIETGSLSLNKDLVKTEGLFDDCITAVEGTAQKKNISIEKNLPDKFPSLLGDKEQLKASIINILGNAVKYTPEGGHIEFGINEQDRMAVFEVLDTGYGMSEEDLSHIFDKFYRSDNSLITEQQGTGLGLAIASEIVHLHDGEIDVQSELGKGTRFSIKIPMEDYYLGRQ